MTIQTLIDNLKECPDLSAETLIVVNNGHADTYAVVDHIFPDKYETISSDFYGTPGVTDERLCAYNMKGKNVAILASEFPYKHAFGDNDINHDIRTINGEGGDEDLVWHLNEFKYIPDIETYIRQEFDKDGNLLWEISYYKGSNSLHVNNCEKHYSASAEGIVGIEDIRNLIDACHIEITLWT